MPTSDPRLDTWGSAPGGQEVWSSRSWSLGGIAVIRGHTAYHVPMFKTRPEVPPPNRPGIPPEIITWADAAYLNWFKEDIAALRQRVTEETVLNAIRQAVQALTVRAEDRLLFALLTHPAPCHHWPALDRLAAAFGRPPAATAAPASSPPLDLEEFRDLLNRTVAEELELNLPPFEPIAEGERAEEVRRQTAEALWQSLVSDTGA